MAKKVTLKYNEKEYNFDLLKGSEDENAIDVSKLRSCLLYTSPSPRDLYRSRMPSSA